MKKIISILMAAILIAGYAGADAKTTKKSTGKKKTSTSSSLPVTKGATQQYGNYLTTQLFTIKKGQDNEIKVEYPIKGNAQLVNAIRKKIKNIVNEKFTGSLETPDALLRSAMKYVGREETIEQDIKVSYANGNVVTYDFSGYEYAGGAHGQYWSFGTTFLVDNGTVFTTDMMPPFYTMRPYILDGMSKKMDMSISELYNGFYSPDSLEDYGSVSITDEGICIVYQPYEIGPWSSGLFTSVIPISEVYDLFSSGAKKFLK